ncbi:MAG: ROK family protein [Phycisphaerae bacterium]|nr:ROK family protein [Phycisphaerae bacterium]
MAKAKTVIGIDLGGTNMQIGVVAPDNKILGRSKKKTRASEGMAKVLDRIAEGVTEACAEAKIPVKQLGGIGIGAPGAIEPHEGIVLQAPNLRWRDVPLAAILRKRFGVPVVVDNDVNVAVYGEWKAGAGKGVDDLAGVWLGTGVGGGLVLNGKLYYGTFFTAGEVGHTILFPFAPPGSQKLEENCSRTAIVDRLLRLVRVRKSIIPELADNDLSEVRAKTVSQAFAKGDQVTHDVIENAAELLGIAIANIVTTLSLPRVVLGGGLSEAMGDDLVRPVREAVRKYVFPDACKKVDVVCTKLMENAGLLGAAMLARERFGGKA